MGCGGSTSRVVTPEVKVSEQNGRVYENRVSSPKNRPITNNPEELSPEELQNSVTMVVLDAPADANASNSNTNNSTLTIEAAATRIQATYRGYAVRKSKKSESDSVFLQDAKSIEPDTGATAAIEEQQTVENSQAIDQGTPGTTPELVVTEAIGKAVKKVTIDEKVNTINQDSTSISNQTPQNASEDKEKDEVLWTSPAFSSTINEESSLEVSASTIDGCVTIVVVETQNKPTETVEQVNTTYKSEKKEVSGNEPSNREEKDTVVEVPTEPNNKGENDTIHDPVESSKGGERSIEEESRVQEEAKDQNESRHDCQQEYQTDHKDTPAESQGNDTPNNDDSHTREEVTDTKLEGTQQDVENQDPTVKESNDNSHTTEEAVDTEPKDSRRDNENKDSPVQEANSNESKISSNAVEPTTEKDTEEKPAEDTTPIEVSGENTTVKDEVVETSTDTSEHPTTD